MVYPTSPDSILCTSSQHLYFKIMEKETSIINKLFINKGWVVETLWKQAQSYPSLTHSFKIQVQDSSIDEICKINMQTLLNIAIYQRTIYSVQSDTCSSSFNSWAQSTSHYSFCWMRIAIFGHLHFNNI